MRAAASAPRDGSASPSPGVGAADSGRKMSTSFERHLQGGVPRDKELNNLAILNDLHKLFDDVDDQIVTSDVKSKAELTYSRRFYFLTFMIISNVA